MELAVGETGSTENGYETATNRLRQLHVCDKHFVNKALVMKRKLIYFENLSRLTGVGDGENSDRFGESREA